MALSPFLVFQKLCPQVCYDPEDNSMFVRRCMAQQEEHRTWSLKYAPHMTEEVRRSVAMLLTPVTYLFIMFMVSIMYEFMCVGVQVCAQTRCHVCRCANVCVVKMSTLGIFLNHFPHSLETGSLPCLEIMSLTRLTGHGAPGIPQSSPSHCTYRHAHCTWFLCGFWGLNSAPCTCMVSTLTAKPSSQLHQLLSFAPLVWNVQIVTHLIGCSSGLKEWSDP